MKNQDLNEFYTEVFRPETCIRNVSEYYSFYVADNLKIMRHLLNTGFGGKFKFIYMDPPFFTGGDFFFKNSFRTSDGKNISVALSAYSDKFSGGLDDYVDFVSERVSLMNELLSEDGILALHVDWRVSHYLKVAADRIFGIENFRNEIIWRRDKGATRTVSMQFPHNHDVILIWSKSGNWTYHRILKPYSANTLKLYSHDDHNGRGTYRLQELRTYSEEKIKEFESDNRIVTKKSGKRYFKQYLNDKKGVAVDSVWDDIGGLPHGAISQKTGYPTQKPEALLNRLISAFTDPGDLIGDFFAGSGTSVVAAEKLGRKWMAADMSSLSALVLKLRLLKLENFKSFSIKKYVYGFQSYEFFERHFVKSFRAKTLRKPEGLFYETKDFVFCIFPFDFPDEQFLNSASSLFSGEIRVFINEKIFWRRKLNDLYDLSSRFDNLIFMVFSDNLQFKKGKKQPLLSEIPHIKTEITEDKSIFSVKITEFDFIHGLNGLDIDLNNNFELLKFISLEVSDEKTSEFTVLDYCLFDFENRILKSERKNLKNKKVFLRIEDASGRSFNVLLRDIHI